ncbi:hypothetical protein Cadr_000028942 [Camelus dromedarius]|uniref:Uncharacterized protein n=1 Tax=Camelus dromedarius TaxID=9838 RepID=A0A5N4C7H7_CAMDR|nr:hypothetical protein Cadr_000028942 [Camelus dromedarius]
MMFPVLSPVTELALPTLDATSWQQVAESEAKALLTQDEGGKLRAVGLEAQDVWVWVGLDLPFPIRYPISRKMIRHHVGISYNLVYRQSSVS